MPFLKQLYMNFANRPQTRRHLKFGFLDAKFTGGTVKKAKKTVFFPKISLAEPG